VAQGGTDVFISLNIRGYANHKTNELTVNGRCALVARPGAHTNVEQVIRDEAKNGKRVVVVFLQETWLQTTDVPLQLTGYKWFGHCRTQNGQENGWKVLRRSWSVGAERVLRGL
jgi:hypothetical protein